jgi:acetate kinase
VNILLLNAGSSSLKATLMKAADGSVIAQGMGDWAGREVGCVADKYTLVDGR